MSEQMHFKQLELNLWDNLEEAAAAPESANFNDLWQQLEATIAPLPQQLQLQTAAEGILKIAQIYASRSDWGCVAKTNGSLVEVAKIPTVARPTHLVYEPRFPPLSGVTFNQTSLVLCVRWYLRYPLSYRNLEEMMLERGDKKSL